MSSNGPAVSVRKVTAAGFLALVAALAWTMLAWATPSKKARNGPLTLFAGRTISIPSSGMAARGKIAFARSSLDYIGPLAEIWVANPDGTGLRRVSRAPGFVLDTTPSWSPDGKRLVFTRCSLHDGCAVWAVNADGTGQHELSKECPDLRSSSCVTDYGAEYSPDGHWVVYNHASDPAEIAIATPDLDNVHSFPVPTATPDIGALAWSPDSHRIAFEARNETKSAVFIAKIDGSDLRRVTPWRLNAYDGGQIDWSANGARILFRSTTLDQNGAPRGGDIYTVRPDGTGLRRLTHVPPRTTNLDLGSFSPNGKWIVFATTAGTTPKRTFPKNGSDIFRMRIDGTGLARVTRTKTDEFSPTWGRTR
jgi:TolB protein